MRRRRKTKYTWLPSDGGDVTSGAFTENLIAFSAGFVIPNSSSLPVGFVTSVIADFVRQDEDTSTNTMADLIGSEYFLKRLVGKLFIEYTTEGIQGDGHVVSPDELETVLCTAGFFVAPVGTDPTTGLQVEDFPIGQNSPTVVPTYNPLAGLTARQPWIWRRSWLLTAGGTCSQWASENDTLGGISERSIHVPSGKNVGSGTFPSNNACYGSVLDGPHVDAKTARRVRKHERLWLAVAAVPFPEGSTIDPDHWNGGQVRVVADMRALGALRRAKNRSSFE